MYHLTATSGNLIIIVPLPFFQSFIFKTYSVRTKTKVQLFQIPSGLKSLGSGDGAVVEAITSHQCGPGSLTVLAML